MVPSDIPTAPPGGSYGGVVDRSSIMSASLSTGRYAADVIR